ncbi:sporulation integral membrane protein YtvI, partial [Tyzzerella sp. OttesenSCG-928-J15]|nr:sporulation integral membrane protein YtvI [Tyzzerella sp. OttesenSCG-928-J15]
NATLKNDGSASITIEPKAVPREHLLYATSEKYKAVVDKIIFLTVTVVFLYLFFNVIYMYVAPFVWGFILSMLLAPIMGFITDKTRLPKGWATIVSLLLILAFVGLIFNVLIRRIIREGQGFFEYLPQYVDYFQNALSGIGDKFSGFYDFVPVEQRATFSEIVSDLLTSLTSAIGPAVSGFSTNFVAKIPNALLSILLAIISSFFFTKDRELIISTIRKITPKRFKKYLSVLKSGIVSGVVGYIKAQGILMSIVAVVCITGLAILGAPYALFLGLIIAIVDALPVFGSGFFYWPWMVFCILTGNYTRAIGLGAIYLLILVIRQTLEPKILGGQIGIHPLVTLMAIYIGLRVFGFFGIFIGPCIAIIIKAVYEMPAERVNMA